ncbi:MAG: 1-(5-phosphoribosyl)-5-[(5-phosphoribosylamino)methylideneamino]imidazole-4-carboxamide isomerase [Bacteroidota bacterium]
MQIIPAIDIIDNTCVRLSEGDFSNTKTYNITPKEKAREFQQAGATWIHVVDLEGARNKRIVNWKAIAEICSINNLHLQLGGGIRSYDDIQRLLSLGVKRIVIGSLAVQSPGIIIDWVRRIGCSVFVIALDIKDGKIATNGWIETDAAPLGDVVKTMTSAGIRRFLSTDIRRDGMLEGPNIELYKNLVQQYPKVKWYASGGVRSIEDIESLERTGVEGAIVGKAIYENRIDINALWKS